MLRLDRALQNNFPRAEIARAGVARCALADVGNAVAEYAAAAFGTRSQRFLTAEVDRLPVGVVIALAEIKLRFEIGRQLDDGDKRLAHATAETLQRTDGALAQKFFDFGRLELATGKNPPHRKIAFLALKPLVVFLNDTAAFGARHQILGERRAGRAGGYIGSAGAALGAGGLALRSYMTGEPIGAMPMGAA